MKAVLIASALAGAVLASPAAAQPADARQAGQSETSDKPSSKPPPPPSIATSLGAWADPGGWRAALDKAGITYGLTYTGEVLGNTSGGLRRGSIDEGRLEITLDADLDTLLGWQGATFHTNLYQIHGHGLSRYYVGNLMTASGIEAVPSTRLYEAWIEQTFLDGRLALRAGQLAADAEFLVSQYGGLFVNGTFGWPAITGADLPNGGPAYPLATPGARVKVSPTENLALLGAVFNGDPAGPGLGDPQRNDRTGTEFRLRDPALLIGEAQYVYHQGKDAAGLPGAIKLGAWHHLGRFDDQRFGNDGLSLADPASNGLAARLRGNSGLYAAIDQMIYRVPGTDDQGIGIFARVSGSPSDRNPVAVYADGGATFKGMLPGRPDDTFGVAASYAAISDRARGLDRDTRFFTGEYGPVRSSEVLIEATYQAQIVPGWTVQPDVQYVFRPGGGIRNPADPAGRRLRDAAIVGVRTTIHY